MRKVLEDVIKQIVDDEQGVKEIALVVKVLERLHKEVAKLPDDVEIVSILDNLVKKGDIVAVNYTLAKYPMKLKTIYFAKGTEIK